MAQIRRPIENHLPELPLLGTGGWETIDTSSDDWEAGEGDAAWIRVTAAGKAEVRLAGETTDRVITSLAINTWIGIDDVKALVSAVRNGSDTTATLVAVYPLTAIG